MNQLGIEDIGRNCLASGKSARQFQGNFGIETKFTGQDRGNTQSKQENDRGQRRLIVESYFRLTFKLATRFI